MGALVLDFLLVIIFLMMIPIGFYRGGLRELCVSGALMLGILLAGEWAGRWSALYERMFGWSEPTATFAMGATIAFGVTALIGYGGSSVLAYQPGPGGRLYGAYLALFNGMVVAGFLINLYMEHIAPETDDESIVTGIVARTLSKDFGWVLLVATFGVGIATVFGMFVRERSPELPSWQPQQNLYQPPTQTKPYRVEDDDQRTAAGPPVRIREVNDWKADAESARPDPSKYGSGWRQTWPDATPAQQRSARRATVAPAADSDSGKNPSADASKNLLADWIKDESES